VTGCFSLSFHSCSKKSDCIWTRPPESSVWWESCGESPACESLRWEVAGRVRVLDWRDGEVSCSRCDVTRGASSRGTVSPGAGVCRSLWSPCSPSCRTCDSCLPSGRDSPACGGPGCALSRPASQVSSPPSPPSSPSALVTLVTLSAL